MKWAIPTAVEQSTPYILGKRILSQWKEDDVARHAAALAYYTAISIAPLLMLVVYLVSYLGGAQREARAQVISYALYFMGPEAADFMKVVMDNASQPSTGNIAGIVGLLTLIWGSTNVFTHLQTSLNKIWGVTNAKAGGLMQIVRHRVLSFTLVLSIAFLLLVSLLFSTVLTAMTDSLAGVITGIDLMWKAVDFLTSFIIVTLLFAAIFKVLPNATIAWRDVWIGAALTAFLFSIGKFALSIYLTRIGSAYGAAGSLIAFLLWVYFSAQILFLGAEFTQVYARYRGRSLNEEDASPARPMQEDASRQATA